MAERLRIPGERTAVVRLGVDPEGFPEAPKSAANDGRASAGRGEAPVTIGFFSRIAPEKGLDRPGASRGPPRRRARDTAPPGPGRRLDGGGGAPAVTSTKFGRSLRRSLETPTSTISGNRTGRGRSPFCGRPTWSRFRRRIPTEGASGDRGDDGGQPRWWRRARAPTPVSSTAPREACWPVRTSRGLCRRSLPARAAPGAAGLGGAPAPSGRSGRSTRWPGWPRMPKQPTSWRSGSGSGGPPDSAMPHPKPTPEAVAEARNASTNRCGRSSAGHFSEATGCPFWLDFRGRLDFDPLTAVRGFEDLQRFPPFEDGLAPRRPAAPVGFRSPTRGVRSSFSKPAGRPESPRAAWASRTSASTTKRFSEVLPDEHFPPGSNWLVLGPTGPRRLRLSVEHLAQFRGGIAFCLDLDPRWVVKVIRKGWNEHLMAYQQHVIDQALTILSAGHDIRWPVHHAEAARGRSACSSKTGAGRLPKPGVRGVFAGGTELTPQWTRFVTEELIEGVFLQPTYGQHAQWVWRRPAPRPRTTVTGSPTTRRCRAPCSKWWTPTPARWWTIRRNRPRPPHHPHPRAVHSRLPRARRRRAGTPVGPLPVGRGQRRTPVRETAGADDRRRLIRPGNDPPCRAARHAAAAKVRGGESAGPSQEQSRRIPLHSAPAVIRVPVLRWGQPYRSLETEFVAHFLTGEPVAK